MMFEQPNPLGLIHLGIIDDHKPGDPPPTGYSDWHAWADVQHKAGLRQKRCGRCQRWFFPVELSDRVYVAEGMSRKRGGVSVRVELVQCKGCAGPSEASP